MRYPVPRQAASNVISNEGRHARAEGEGEIVMTILICLALGYLAAVAGFWVVIAVIWDPWAEYREWQ